MGFKVLRVVKKGTVFIFVTVVTGVTTLLVVIFAVVTVMIIETVGLADSNLSRKQLFVDDLCEKVTIRRKGPKITNWKMTVT